MNDLCPNCSSVLDTHYTSEGEYQFCKQCYETSPISYAQAIDEWLDQIEKNQNK